MADIKTKQVYSWVLKELDKWQSPTFDPVDFDYHFNSALDEYLSNQLPEGQIVQKGADDLDAFIIYDKALDAHSSVSNLFKLPGDYRHVWVVKVQAKWLSNFGKYKKDETIVLYPKRRRSEREGYQQQNAYQQPSEVYPLYRRMDKDDSSHLQILLGDKLTPITCTLDYIADQQEFTYSEDTVIPLPKYVIREIAKLTARKFIENIESQRYNSQLQETQLRNE